MGMKERLLATASIISLIDRSYSLGSHIGGYTERRKKSNKTPLTPKQKQARNKARHAKKNKKHNHGKNK